jgi:hypothetical protein
MVADVVEISNVPNTHIGMITSVFFGAHSTPAPFGPSRAKKRERIETFSLERFGTLEANHVAQLSRFRSDML